MTLSRRALFALPLVALAPPVAAGPHVAIGRGALDFCDPPVSIGADGTPFTRALDALEAELDGHDLASLPQEVVPVLRRLLDGSFDWGRIERKDLAAPGAGKLLVVFEPSDELLGLVAALRAGNGKRGVIEQGAGHDNGLHGGLSDSMLAGRVPGVESSGRGQQFAGMV